MDVADSEIENVHSFLTDYFAVSLNLSLDALNASNSGLDYLRGTLGRSYMCREEQTLSVDEQFSLNTYQLQVQPFAVRADQFGEGEFLRQVWTPVFMF